MTLHLKPEQFPNCLWSKSVCFTRTWEDCGGLSDCEELSRGYSQEMKREREFIGIDSQFKCSKNS